MLRESRTLKSRDTSWLAVWLLERKKSEETNIHVALKIKSRDSLKDDSNSHLLTEQWVGPHLISLKKRGESERSHQTWNLNHTIKQHIHVHVHVHVMLVSSCTVVNWLSC